MVCSPQARRLHRKAQEVQREKRPRAQVDLHGLKVSELRRVAGKMIRHIVQGGYSRVYIRMSRDRLALGFDLQL